MSGLPLFSIITPSFRASQWLRLCVASVADQNQRLEHLVQDAGSDDGTLDWLLKDARVKTRVEKDQGMYDAVNRGLRRAQGEILSYLNCDEQYLPGTLDRVEQFFAQHPKIEVLFADALVVKPSGEYLCHRQASLPGKLHTWVSGNLAVLTCATFFRRKLIDRGVFFDSTAKAVGDGMWVLDLIRRRVAMAVMNEVTSVFTDTGENLSLHPKAQKEAKAFFSKAPVWARWGKPVIVLHYRLRRLLAGHYSPRPVTYSIYTQRSPHGRVAFAVSKPTFRWKR